MGSEDEVELCTIRYKAKIPLPVEEVLSVRTDQHLHLRRPNKRVERNRESSVLMNCQAPRGC
jgi:hypothetical protein